MKTYKKGISLIVLVITVIVLAILATTVIISLSNTNIITEANKAVDASNQKQVEEAIQLSVASYILDVKGGYEEVPTTVASAIAKLNEYMPENVQITTDVNGNLTSTTTPVVCSVGNYDLTILLDNTGNIQTTREIITNYTQEDIDNSNGMLIAIGKTNSLYVVAKYNENKTSVTITKNGINSDGDIKGPISLYTPFENTVKNAIIKEGITSMHGDLFHGLTSLESVSLPNRMTSFGGWTFYGCTNLKSIIIPEGVTFLGQEEFGECINLENVVMPNTIVRIDDSAFDGCVSLKSVNLPDSVELIEVLAFGGCTSLEEIVISGNVKKIGLYAFRNCSNLTKITFNGTMAQWNAITFGEGWNDNTGNYIIYCTDGNISKS